MPSSDPDLDIELMDRVQLMDEIRKLRKAIREQLAKDLEMILVENEDQLLAVLSDHQPGKPQLDKTTDLDDVVAIIDGDFQKSLNEKRG